MTIYATETYRVELVSCHHPLLTLATLHVLQSTRFNWKRRRHEGVHSYFYLIIIGADIPYPSNVFHSANMTQDPDPDVLRSNSTLEI